VDGPSPAVVAFLFMMEEEMLEILLVQRARRREG
jgi:hypothetical protein